MSKKKTSKLRFALVPHPGCVCPLCLMHGSNGFHYTHEFDPHGGKDGGTKKCKCEFVAGENGKTRIEGYDPSKCYSKWQQSLKSEAELDEPLLFTSGEEADKYLRPIVDARWEDVTYGEKDAILYYTEDSNPINIPVYKGEKMSPEALGHFGELTNVVEKYEMPREYVAFRGTNERWLAGVWEEAYEPEIAQEWLERTIAQIAGGDEDALQMLSEELTGSMLNCEAFTSLGSTLETSYQENIPITMVVRMPKGTKAMYLEPQSFHGSTVGAKNPMYYEPGMAKRGVGEEAEILLQRNSDLVVNSVAFDEGTGKIVLDVVVSNQGGGYVTGLENLPWGIA